MKRLVGLQEPLRIFPDDPPLAEMGADGKPVVVLVKLTLATVLARSQSDDPARTMDLAIRIRSAEDGLTVDDSDLALIKDCLEKDQTTVAFAKKACMDVVASAEEVEVE